MRFLIIFLLSFSPAIFAEDKQIEASKKDNFEALNFFGSVLDRVEKEYVDVVPFEKLVDFAVEGLLSGLDRHSYLIKKNEYQDMRNQMSGEFGGLGIEIVVEDGLIRVVTPMDDSPAKKAGMLSGDLITHVDDKPIAGMSSEKAIEKLKGKPGTKVKVSVRRDKKAMDFTIKRELIKTKPVKIKREGDYVVARIATFMDAHTVDKFMDEYNKIKADQKPIKGMVLDLRNNGGGLLDEAVSVTSLFLEKGKEVVSTRGRKKGDVQRYKTSGNNIFKDMPLVVLINRATASAPEIVAGALQDHKRALIMGERSYGKGSVQTVIPLRDNRAIRLTTARYYTPSGDTIQDEGVKADIEVPLGILEKVDLGPRYSEKDLDNGVKKKQQDDEGEKLVDPKTDSKDEKKEEPKEEEKEDIEPEDASKEDQKEDNAEDKKDKSSDKANDKKLDTEKDKNKKDKKELIDYQVQRALDLLQAMTLLKTKQ